MRTVSVCSSCDAEIAYDATGCPDHPGAAIESTTINRDWARMTTTTATLTRAQIAEVRTASSGSRYPDVVALHLAASRLLGGAGLAKDREAVARAWNGMSGRMAA